jgi:hypothetical protein
MRMGRGNVVAADILERGEGPDQRSGAADPIREGCEDASEHVFAA